MVSILSRIQLSADSCTSDVASTSHPGDGPRSTHSLCGLTQSHVELRLARAPASFEKLGSPFRNGRVIAKFRQGPILWVVAMLFQDRFEAGQLLASRLSHFANRPDVVVLALPRGGVPVGYELAKALNAPLDVFVVRKL